MCKHDEVRVNDNKSFLIYNKIFYNANLQIQESTVFCLQFDLTKRILTKKKKKK